MNISIESINRYRNAAEENINNYCLETWRAEEATRTQYKTLESYKRDVNNYITTQADKFNVLLPAEFYRAKYNLSIEFINSLKN